MKYVKKNISYLFLIYLLFLYNIIYAEIITDGTMGPKTSLLGTDFNINESLGSRQGDNLFHSFQEFNIHTGETATFTGSPSIKNVISRVTGGNLSTINGLLKSEVGSQGFYFINPAGVFFGPQAQVKVPSSLYISTAKQLVFSDGQTFNSTAYDKSSLSIASPKAFGFSSGQHADITIDRSTLILEPNSTFSLTAKDIYISGTEADNADITSHEGKIELIAQGMLGTPSNNILINQAREANYGGELQLQHVNLDVQGNGSGSIGIYAKNASLINTQIKLNNEGDTHAQGSGLHIKTTNLNLDKTRITAQTLGAGNGAKIEIDITNQMSLKNDTLIMTQNEIGSSGLNSDININAKQLLLTDKAEIKSLTLSDKQAGNINITSNNIILDGYTSSNSTGSGAIIRSESQSKIHTSGQTPVAYHATGNAGNISINAKTLDILRTGVISTSTYALGDGGTISLHVDTLNIDSQSYMGKNFDIITKEPIPVATGIFSASLIFERFNLKGGPSDQPVINPITNKPIINPATGEPLYKPKIVDFIIPAEGNAGNININAKDSISLLNGGWISTNTKTSGDAGQIQIKSDNILIDQNSGLLSLSLVSGISSDTTSTGNAGNISIESKNIHLFDFANLSTSSSNLGNAANLKITTDSLSMNNGASIVSTAYSSGNAGNISISSDNIKMQQNSLISVKGTDQSIKNSILLTPSINLQSNSIEMLDASNISAQSSGSANAAEINISAKHTIEIKDLSRISSDAVRSNAGAIIISGNQLLLEDGLITTSVGRSSDATSVIFGDGGNITINNKNLLLLGSAFIQANTQGRDGHGGDIVINSDTTISSYKLEIGGGEPRNFVENSGLNIIQAASPQGAPGNIDIRSPIRDLSTELAVIKADFQGLQNLVDDPCQLQSDDKASSLIFSGKKATSLRDIKSLSLNNLITTCGN